ncbi:MAG TPA: aminomethyl-transferring glycine dehydrogenase subunit GcvPB [bacterium]|nr:aminomethyl-transferring glycine dehydrogenase subunit GcvPB [bacterium]
MSGKTKIDNKVKKLIDPKITIRERFHQQKWQEPLVYDLGRPGERGIVAVELEPEIRSTVGDPTALVPAGMVRKTPPQLPEVAQPRAMKHFVRLSQETSCEDSAIDFNLGTCSMKYNPKSHERLAEMAEFLELHPRQDGDTVQGILEIMYKFGEYLKALSGFDGVSLLPACGSQGVFANSLIIRAYQEEHGFGVDKKDEIITTIFSHPCNPATPAMTGYKIVTLYPDETGWPSLEKFKAAVSERTAGLVICCPDDTGIFNPDIEAINQVIHDAGGLCILDSANANGYFGWARAKESGFDLTHWNLHKSFASPHGGCGPGAGPIAVREDLVKYLPVPVIGFDGKRYYLDYERPDSIGKIRSFYGNVGVVLRAFSWVTSLGSEGLKEVTQTAVLNNNYLRHLFADIPQIEMPYTTKDRMHEIRWSFDKVFQDTGININQITARFCDYGIGPSFTSHFPYLVPNPLTPEPTETVSKEELEEFAAVVKRVVEECYTNPDIVKTAPHRTSKPALLEEDFIDPGKIAPSRTVWERVHKIEN